MKQSKSAWIATIRASIAGNDKAAVRALRVIYSYQTADEQQAADVRYHNNVGFSPVDAEFLTSLHGSLLRYGNLTQNQLIWAKKKLAHYAGQLFENAVREGRYVKEGRYYVDVPKVREEATA